MWWANFDRSRLLAEGEILVMGALHYDNAAYHGSFHELHAAAKEGGGSTRDGHFDLCWNDDRTGSSSELRNVDTKSGQL